ncbi:mediator of RNA polymerase II transcription subunit 4 [[Candida] railenensis]|uniref:Mediator of RNA polymerase II transcription subunit 4 n=1 Tax=[Candida] railenensis TaxID=45579 RepID=A0A9P0QTI7_9ASCO|nr:mediator of RNA polymerase II transcription subunit 4 [[Candida] railenensis]
MLPHRKSDQAFLSVPVSRVASSQRLNQLSSPQASGIGSPNAYASIPTTPVPYVSSSLNPTRNQPVISGSASTSSNNKNTFQTAEEAKRFEKLPIVEKLGSFERALTLLSQDITSYRENDDRIQSTVKELIDLNDSIYSDISQLDVHQKLGGQIKVLEEEKKRLDTTSRDTLKQLIEYRNELKKLPLLPTNKRSKRAGTDNKDAQLVDIKEILKYAMKLSKFTKIPPSAVDLPQQAHPNNYIWPAEDALRRGMLAISSLRPDELISAELGEEEKASTETTNEPAAMEDVENVHSKAARSPHQHRASHHSAPVAKEEPKDLDVDLFDPDDDFSD